MARGRRDTEKAPATSSPEEAIASFNEAEKLAMAGRLAEAEPRIKESLDAIRRTLGPDYPAIGAGLRLLSQIYTGLKLYKESEEYARRAVEFYERKFGPEHPETALSREALATSLLDLGLAPSAIEQIDMARRVRRRILDRTLPALSEDDQIALLRSRFETAYCIDMHNAMAIRNVPNAADYSASWILNHKAVATSALAQRAILGREAADSRAAPIIRDLTEARRSLAALAFAQTTADAESGKKFEQLVARERELSRQLAQTLKWPERDDPWVPLNDIRAAIPSDAVLVEFAWYEKEPNTQVPGKPFDKPQSSRPGRYAAWVVPPPGGDTVRLIDLGESGPIDEAIAAVRRGMRLDRTPGVREGDVAGTDARSGLTRPGGAQSGRETERDAVTRLAPALQTLAGLILGPLRPHIDSARRWVLSPDSSLWLVPWQALPLDDGRHAIEQHLIHLVVSGRDLASPAGETSSAPPVHFADPDFDLASSAGAPSSPAVAAPGGPTAAERAAMNRALTPGFHAARLPGTGTEADGVYPLLAQYTGAKPVLYKQAEATEARFRELRRPRVLILSTHGLFLDQSEPSSAGRLPENPLLRCGLLLAGANHGVEVDGGAAGDNQGLDGVLTGLAIVGSDLQGTSLVVLSACETALGQVQSGEGVAGLRQAFQLAGAKSVVATLWQIPDAESSRLMIGFFSHLSSGLGPASALRRAQLDELQLRRRSYGAAHPYYWAAFTLTGQPGEKWASEPLGDDGNAPPVRELLAQGPGPDRTRGLDTAPAPAPRPADSVDPSAGASPPVAASSPAPTTQPGRTGADNPFIDWAVMIVVIVCATAAARWWWLRGPPGTV